MVPDQSNVTSRRTYKHDRLDGARDDTKTDGGRVTRWCASGLVHRGQLPDGRSVKGKEGLDKGHVGDDFSANHL